MKILLVSPWDKRHYQYRSLLKFLFIYPPLTLPMLAALVPRELNAEICVFDEISGKKVPSGTFDVVGITALTLGSARAYELADHYRKQGAFVVLGGYHPTFMPDEALNHADAIVVGYGTSAWPELLRDLAAGRPTKRIYRDDTETRDIDIIPDRTIIKSPPYCPVDTVVASRGCPNHCSFCSISQMTRYRQRPVNEVIAELRGLKRRRVIFYDPNFFADRTYALELMESIEPLRLRWGATATVDFGFDEELIIAARKAGCMGVLLGFESLNASALDGVNKKFRNPESYRQAIENIHRSHISVTGTFVLGLDEDTEEDLISLPGRVLELGIDLPLFFILTPAPGGSLFDQLKSQNRILTEDWSRYTQSEVVFRPHNMTAERLFELYSRTWSEAYTFRNVLHRIINAPGTSLYHKVIVFCMNTGFKFMGWDKGQPR